MKRFYACLIIFAVLLSSCFIILHSITKTRRELVAKIDMAYNTALEGDIEKAYQMAVSYEEAWIEAESKLMIYIRQSQLDPLNASAAKIVTYISQNEIPDFLAELKSMRIQLEQLWETEFPLPQNLL